MIYQFMAIHLKRTNKNKKSILGKHTQLRQMLVNIIDICLFGISKTGCEAICDSVCNSQLKRFSRPFFFGC